jgi:iron complex transport system ATP-binding protein
VRLIARDVHARLGKTRILQGIDLEAHPGQILALLGPNGAGKSTFLRAAAGLLPLEQGTIRLDEADLTRLDPRERARRIGLVPQEHKIRYPFTVEEIVQMGRHAHQGLLQAATPGDHEHIHEALKRTHIEHLRHRNVMTLSGGERQRVLIARVLAQDPQVYLFDEPTASLDIQQAHHTTKTLREIASQAKAVIVVLHDLEEASRIADRAALIAHGRIIATGTPKEVIAPGPIQAAYGANTRIEWSDDQEDGARIRILETP